MGTILASVAGLSIWLVLWSLDFNAVDGFMVALLIIMTALTLRIAARYLPSNREY